MNRWFLLVFLCLISVAVAFAQGVPSPSTPKIMLSDGSYWTGASSVTIGSISVDVGSPPDNASTTAVTLVANTSQVVASLANRESVAVFNTNGTVFLWASFDSVTASAAVLTTIPIPPNSYISTKLDSSLVVGVVASEAMTAIVYQDGYK